VPANTKKRGIDIEVVRTIAVSLPDVEESTSSRGTGFKVRGKLFACEAIHKSAEPNSLMVRIDTNDRERLLATETDTYYLTDHYRAYPAVLVRLSRISRKALRALLKEAMQFVTGDRRG
jgi:hypothetical protein